MPDIQLPQVSATELSCLSCLYLAFFLYKKCININRKIVLYKRIVYFLNEYINKMYYRAYVLPVFDYCSVVWGKNISCSNKLHALIMRLIFSTTSDNAFILQK